MRHQEGRSVARRNAEWSPRLSGLRSLSIDEIGLLDDANQQGGDRWMLVAHVSGPLRLQPELHAQTAWGGVVVLVRKPGFLETHRFSDIRLQKCHDLENQVRVSQPFDRVHMTSYCSSIVTMALSCVVSQIFNVEKCSDLEILVRGHSRSLKIVPFDTLDMVSY